MTEYVVYSWIGRNRVREYATSKKYVAIEYAQTVELLPNQFIAVVLDDSNGEKIIFQRNA